MKAIRVFLAIFAMAVLTHEVFAAPSMKLKMAESFVKTAEGGGFTAKSAAKEARQRIDALKEEYPDDADVLALDNRLLAVEGKEQAAKAAKQAEAAKKAEEAKAAEEVKAKDLYPAPVVTAGHKAPLPWIMAKDDKDRMNGPIVTYIKNLGKEDAEDVKELDKQLRERAEEDRKIVAAGGEGKFAAQQELDRYETFLYRLGDQLLAFNGKIDLEQGKATFISYPIFMVNSSTSLEHSKKDNKFYFFGQNGEPEYIRGDNLAAIKVELKRMYYINVFCDSQTNKEFQKTQTIAALCCNYGQQAIKNNTIDIVRLHPMPEKGSLHNGLAKEALACALTKYPNAVDVVIGDSDWTIMRNSLGIILRRVCCGWIIVKDDIGRQAIPAKWAQPNAGGDTYTKLELYIYGGNDRFYLK